MNPGDCSVLWEVAPSDGNQRFGGKLIFLLCARKMDPGGFFCDVSFYDVNTVALSSSSIDGRQLAGLKGVCLDATGRA
jgi:hypothetical protein